MEVELRNATITHSRTKVLDDFSVTFCPGEITAVAGLHGSGKTTVMRALAGAVTLSSGELVYGGSDVLPGDPKIEQSAFFVPATPPLIHSETVLRNISRFLTRYETDQKIISDRVFDLLTRFELVQHVDKPVAELTVNLAARVIFPAIAAINPKVWILDEPFESGLSKTGKELVTELLVEAAEAGNTVIYSTAHLEVPLSPASRICIANRGRNYATGTPEEIEKQAETDHLLATLLP